MPSSDVIKACAIRHIPRDMLLLLSKLVNLAPEARPTAEKVRLGIKSLVRPSASTPAQRC